MTMVRLVPALLTLALMCGGLKEALSEEEYSVYLATRPLTPLIVYDKPAIRTKFSRLEPQQESRQDVPAVLCGAHVIEPDLLLTSIRCSPRSPSMADIYVYPKESTQNLFQLTTNRIIRNGVTDIQFKPEYKLGEELISNAALIKLDKPYFAK